MASKETQLVQVEDGVIAVALSDKRVAGEMRSMLTDHKIDDRETEELCSLVLVINQNGEAGITHGMAIRGMRLAEHLIDQIKRIGLWNAPNGHWCAEANEYERLQRKRDPGAGSGLVRVHTPGECASMLLGLLGPSGMDGGVGQEKAEGSSQQKPSATTVPSAGEHGR